jgi:hypothetical protein
MGKLGGSTLVVIIALAVGLATARTWLRERLTAMLQDTDKYAVWPDSSEVIEQSEITFSEPVYHFRRGEGTGAWAPRCRGAVNDHGQCGLDHAGRTGVR